MPSSVPFPAWCDACVEVDPRMPPRWREAQLNTYAAYASHDPRIQRIALALLANLTRTLGRPPNAVELLQYLMECVHDLVDYLPVPAGKEIMQPVWSALTNGMGHSVSTLTGQRKGGGNCKEFAQVFVTLALCLGFRASVQWIDQEGADLNHVAARVCDGGAFPTNFGSPRCIPMETTIPGAFVGESTQEALRRLPDFRSRLFG